MNDKNIDFFHEINSCKYLYLRKLWEPEDNSLKLLVEAAIEGKESVSVSGMTLEGNIIEPVNKGPIFEIYFDSYIGYSIIDESLALPDDSEEFEGRVFCVYTKSNYLDYLRKASFASDAHPGPFVHFGFNCLNHIVDVASADEPEVRIVGG